MPKANILIVEDEHIIALDIRNNLEFNGYKVIGQADRGEEAINMVGELRPNLALMDINLKGDMDGIETASQIRDKFDIPVIFLTAFSDASTLERAQLAEPFGYILKPFNERELVSNIEMALYRHRMERKLRDSENKFRKVIEHSSDGIILADKQGNLIEWNQAAEQISGLKRSDLLGQSISEVIFRMLPASAKTAAAREINKNAWDAAVDSGYTSGLDHMFEVEIETPEGERRVVQTNGFLVETDQGAMAGAIMRDITKQKQAEAELLKLTQAVKQSANAIVVTDIEGNIEYANPRFTEITGYSLSEVSGKNPRILRSGEHGPAFYQHLWQTIKSGNVWNGELHNKRKDGMLYWENTTISPVYDPTGKLINFIAIKEDITSRKLLEKSERDQRQLAESLRDTALALNSTLQLDNVLDRILENVGKLVSYDTAMVLLVEGYTVRKIRSHSNGVQKSLNPPQIGNTQANLINVPILQEMQQTRKPCLIPDTLADRRWRAIPGMTWIRSFISAPVEIHGRISGLINIISAEPDFFTPLHAERLMAFASQAAIAIENARLFEQTHQLSITDPLTELYNRRHFFEIALLEFERTHRYNRALSAMMIDIDYFKNINDAHGHAVGDLALCEIVARIKNTVRVVDIVARFGGEEFVVLMPETGLDEARQVAERIRQVVANHPIEYKDAIILATLSLGVAEADKNTKDLDELIKSADRALYKAKARGRNCVESCLPGE